VVEEEGGRNGSPFFGGGKEGREGGNERNFLGVAKFSSPEVNGKKK